MWNKQLFWQQGMTERDEELTAGTWREKRAVSEKYEMEYEQ